MCFAPGWNSFASRFVPRAVVRRTLIDYEEEWWKHTPFSESNTNAERLWFISVDRETIFWAGIQLLRPVTSLGHQEGRRVFWEGLKSFELCSVVLNDVQHIFLRGKKFLGEAWHPPPVTGLQLLGGQQEVPVNTVLSQHPQKLFKRNLAVYFPKVDKHVWTSSAWSQDFSKICWRVDICSVVLQPRRKQHWISSSFGSIIFAASWHTLLLGG